MIPAVFSPYAKILGASRFAPSSCGLSTELKQLWLRVAETQGSPATREDRCKQVSETRKLQPQRRFARRTRVGTERAADVFIPHLH